MTTTLSPEQIAAATQITNERGAAHDPTYTYAEVKPSNSDQTTILTVNVTSGPKADTQVTGKANPQGFWLRAFPGVDDAYTTAIEAACDDVEKVLDRGPG
jgi:hypothetical protein